MSKNEFEKYIPDGVAYLGELMKANNYKFYIVGGYTRDIILGQCNLNGDIDVCGDCLPENFLEVIENEQRIKVGTSNFPLGTIKLIIDEKLDVEYTCFRKESYRGDGHHTPNKVVFTDDVYIDASRRDFTINAIYLDPVTCEVYDPFNGVEHIDKRLIKTTRASLDVFNEDALRLLRMCRFAGKLNFDVEQNTLKAAKKCASLLINISSERIGVEMYKIICENKYPISSFKAIYNSFINRVVCPSISYDQAIKVLNVNESNIVKWAVFLAELSCKDVYSYIMDLHLGKTFAKQVELIVEKSLLLKDMDDDVIKIEFAQIGEENTKLILDFNRVQNASLFYELNRIFVDMKEKAQFIKVKDLGIDGHDIKNNLHVENEIIGQLIKEAYSYVVLNPEKNNYKDIIEYIKNK